MSHADGLDAQRALAACLRNPLAPLPAGVDARRVQVYRRLVANNVRTLLATAFPVLRRLHDDAAWDALVDDFLGHHGASTPLFTELPREFLGFLDARLERGCGDAPWLGELAHYEWAELALQQLDAEPPAETTGDVLTQPLALSQLAWPLAYAWPVERIAPTFRPTQPEPQPTLLLLTRDAEGQVRFSRLTPAAFALLQTIEATPARTGDDYLADLAQQAGVPGDATLISAGRAMLEQFARERVLGRPAGPAAGVC